MDVRCHEIVSLSGSLFLGPHGEVPSAALPGRSILSHSPCFERQAKIHANKVKYSLFISSVRVRHLSFVLLLLVSVSRSFAKPHEFVGRSLDSASSARHGTGRDKVAEEVEVGGVGVGVLLF